MYSFDLGMIASLLYLRRQLKIKLKFHYDPLVMKQADFLVSLIDTEARVSESVADMVFPGRRITFPIVLDDSWNREALQRYMGTTRDKAVYLPSNIQYLARNNGLEGGSSQALEKLVESDWVSLLAI